MRYWRLSENMPFETFVSPDGLHMNDWSYACIAKLLAASRSADKRQQERPTQTAGDASRRRA